MLRKEHFCCICFYRKILLNNIFFFSSKWRISKNNIKFIFFLNRADISCKSIFFVNIWVTNPVQNHIHHSHNICKWSFFISKKCLIVEKIKFFIIFNLFSHKIKCFYQKSTTSRSWIINCLSNFWFYNFNNYFNNASRCIKFSRISSIISHSHKQIFINF